MKTNTAITAFAAIAPLVVLAAIAVILRDDPSSPVSAIDVGRTGVSVSTGPVASPDGPHRIAALDLLEGTLEQRGDDSDDLYIGVVGLEFGPEEWVITAGVMATTTRTAGPRNSSGSWMT